MHNDTPERTNAYDPTDAPGMPATEPKGVPLLAHLLPHGVHQSHPLCPLHLFSGSHAPYEDANTPLPGCILGATNLSIKPMSLSMVFGTPATVMASLRSEIFSNRACAPRMEPSPPMMYTCSPP